MATKTIKASPRGTKTAAKKKGILRKINLYSRKTQFVLIVLLIAVAGGGYFTYKSFAATTVYSAGGDRLSFTHCKKYNTTRVNEPQKQNSTVVEMGVGGCAHSTAEVGMTTGTYQTCVSAKGVGTISFLYSNQNVPINSPGTYINVCDTPKFWNYGPGGNSSRIVGINYANPANGGKIRIAVVSFDKTDAAAPAPAPAK